MTTSWSRSPLQPLRYSGDNVRTLHKRSKCWWWRCQSVIICLRLNDCRNPQFRCAVHLISFTEVVGCSLPTRLSQFVELHMLLPNPLHALLDHFGDCAHHPAWFVILAQLAQLSLLLILIVPILPIVGTCNITESVSDSNQLLLKCYFGLSGGQSRNFSTRHIVLLLLNCCLCIFNSISCPCGFSLNIILNPLPFLFIAWEVCTSTFLRRNLLVGSQAAQFPKGSDSLCLQAALALICLRTSRGWPLCRFTVSARRKWRKVLFHSVDHCILRGLCCWARCWMVQVMDNMEASCVCYVKVSTFTHLEQSKISLLTVNKSGIVTLTVQHDKIVSVIFK